MLVVRCPVNSLTMTHSSTSQLFLTTTAETVIGIRMDQILSFTYVVADQSLSIRYIGDTTPEKFRGGMAEAILRELRYAGRT